MGPKTVELRPERKKLQRASNFDGYKLNLDPIPVLRFTYTYAPLRVCTTERQFSYLHAQLFAFHNYLSKDPWHLNTCYFIDEQWTIQKIIYDDESGKVKPLNAVLKLPKPSVSVEDRYPACLIFVSEKFCLGSDGYGTLFVVDTGDRERNCEFKVRQVLKPLEDVEGFVISNARFDILDGIWKINCVLSHVKQNKENFETVAHWISLRLDENVWKVEASKVIKSRGAFTYCALEHRSGALIVACDHPVDFESNIKAREQQLLALKSQSEQETHVETSNESKEDTEMMEKDILTPKFTFTWQQTDEDVTITFNEQADAVKSDYYVQVTRDHILIKFKNEVMLEGNLFAMIDSDTTTWTIDNRYLQVTLNKTNEAPWPFLIPGSGPENANNGTETDPNPNPISTFGTQMEECDFDVNELDKENYLSRLVWTSEDISHKVYLGTSTPLFEVNLRPGLPNAIALKHDVDACVWLQTHNNNKTSDWTMTHETTIDAFSYVLASKQQKKFVGCAPNGNYVVICESERHVFIYKQTYDGAGNLRNRNSNTPVNIGQQKLVTLENTGEVLGMCVENDVTILLTTQFMLCIQLKIEE